MQVGEELQCVMAICSWKERSVELWVGCESSRWWPPFWGTKVACAFGRVLLWLANLWA